MQRSVFDQQLNREPFTGMFRKVIDQFHFSKWSTKKGMGIFSGTLLLGTGLVLATAQANPVTAPSAIPTQAITPALTTEAPSVEQPAHVESSIESEANTDASGDASGDQTNDASNHVQIKVNGQDITVPANGAFHQTVTDNNGTTNIQVTTQSSNQNGTTSYTNVQTSSYSTGVNTTSSTVSGVNN